jgi:hypothetical protein
MCSHISGIVQRAATGDTSSTLKAIAQREEVGAKSKEPSERKILQTAGGAGTISGIVQRAATSDTSATLQAIELREKTRPQKFKEPSERKISQTTQIVAAGGAGFLQGGLWCSMNHGLDTVNSTHQLKVRELPGYTLRQAFRDAPKNGKFFSVQGFSSLYNGTGLGLNLRKHSVAVGHAQAASFIYGPIFAALGAGEYTAILCGQGAGAFFETLFTHRYDTLRTWRVAKLEPILTDGLGNIRQIYSGFTAHMFRNFLGAIPIAVLPLLVRSREDGQSHAFQAALLTGVGGAAKEMFAAPLDRWKTNAQEMAAKGKRHELPNFLVAFSRAIAEGRAWDFYATAPTRFLKYSVGMYPAALLFEYVHPCLAEAVQKSIDD